MADELKNSTTISKQDEGFPAYLDFEKLRTEGIEYLGKLAGKIWTDHNVHDPGITILEMLCYALLDLGYRTQLPLEDILTRNPDNTTPDNNFFTPAQILACNPLTVTDFRKLLVDIEGIKNAWLEPATDITDFCRSYDEAREETTCESFLNGLYHVYLDLEKDIDSYGELDSDFENKKQARTYKEKVIDRVKDALMAHRNICEDFVDIHILCKFPMGVCAEIELEENVKADEVYITVAEELRNFFTPAPRFYTLQQLLEKGTPIDEIFAGRPYNHTYSHGFVDVEEFEELKLKKEIHLSDVYDVLFNVPGVRSVKNLSLRSCDGKTETSVWKFSIKKNYVPEFSIRCSGFRFTRHDMPLSVDFKKYQGLFELNFSHSGKVLYELPSPYLDTEIPQGRYRSDLTDYYSIQNEFPRVYAIEEGGLGADAPDARKAQALQLKGYLLFFDQLLANYLSQLNSLRSLFALSSPENENEQHTYFINGLNTVPELQKLLRFRDAANGENNGSASREGTLVFPFDKKKLFALKESDQLKYFDLEKASPTAFETEAEKDIEVSLLKNDLYVDENVRCEYITKTDGCIFYYILTSSNKIALISKKYFKNTDRARGDAASVKYSGAFDKNYRSFVDSKHHFSFTIEMNPGSFAEYLQLLVEDRGLYLQRRGDFLEHLLARFAEQFTDYALLTFGNLSNEQIKEAKIEATEKFLTNYDDLSSNRGKSYDYRVNGWNNDNVSGFEKRVKSLSGMENWKRRSLCNFEVNRYDEQYTVTLKIGNRSFFTLRKTFDSREKAQEAARAFLSGLSNLNLYHVRPVSRQRSYAIDIRENGRILATYKKTYETQEEARIAIQHLHRLFSGNPASVKDTFASQFIFQLQLKGYKGDVVCATTKTYDTEVIAKLVAANIKQGVNDEDRWQPEGEASAPTGRLFRVSHSKNQPRFINLDAFKIDTDNTLADKPEIFRYDLLDSRNRFKFRSLEEFNSEEQAREHWRKLLGHMTHAENYKIKSEEDADSFSLHVVADDEDKAVCSEDFNSEKKARRAKNEILSVIRQHLYSLTIKKIPARWKFSFRLGIEQAHRFTFASIDEYETKEAAMAAAAGFKKSLSTVEVWKYKDEDRFRLVPVNAPEKIPTLVQVQPDETRANDNSREKIKRYLLLQKEVNRLLEEPGTEAFAASVDLDYLSKQGLFVYRLIDKNTIPARYSDSFRARSDALQAMKTLRKVRCEDYSALEICIGGNIFNERTDKNTGTTWYHYQIRSRNRFDESGDELTLFESAQGYRTKGDAQKAFSENYLQILEWASHSENYGSIISMEQILIHQPEDCFKNEKIVFVPRSAREEWGDETTDKLVSLAKSYPVRLVVDGSETFYRLFPCEESPEKREERICEPAEQQFVYYFRLHSAEPAHGHKVPYWQSTDYFETPEEARRAYRFFRMLLCYPGNFFVRCDPCDQGRGSNRYRIYLREVLAESTSRFSSEEEAWGKEGVQKFICVSQAEGAFHPYRRAYKNKGCYTFYLACAYSVIYHPCHYNTQQKRDQAIENLFLEFQKRHKNRAWQYEEVDVKEKTEEYFLLDENGTRFARTKSKYSRYPVDACTELVMFFEKINQNKIIYATDENGLLYAHDPDGENSITIQNHDNIAEKEWKETLEAFACYYPIVKRRNETTGDDEYCIEIKLPGFDACGEDADEDKPCGCNGKEQQPKPACYVAWKSHCCFTTCKEALDALRDIRKLLLKHSNYRPRFDCDCYDFSIALHYSKKEGEPEIAARERGLSPGESEMVALNPQCYANPDEVCAAIERTWKLINAEGLHMAEHILLRPRCEEDCRCEQASSDCINDINCNFTWSEPDDDPCADQPDVCFILGADPYSFIATIVLPAWPARFRSPENRQMLENILYREAPAHVLLRILWLAPHDFCCFEKKYKQWGRWLAGEKSCGENFSRCDFLEFLFRRNYECLEECDICGSCDEEKTESAFCTDTWSEESISDPYKYLNQINDWYCWKKQDCYEYEFTPCDSEVAIEDDNEGDDVILSSQRSPAAQENAADATESEETEERKSTLQVVNSRMAQYRAAVDRVLEQTNKHQLVEKTKAFVADPKPSPQRASNLLIEIAENKSSTERETLSKNQTADLLKNILCYYLDTVYFNGKDYKNVEALQPAIEAMKEAETNVTPATIYEYWKPEMAQLYESEIDLAAIRRIITGRDEN